MEKGVDYPIIALLCSIFLGPLGIQGWIVSPTNRNYSSFARHQRNISIAIYILIFFYLLFSVIYLTTTTGLERQMKKNGSMKKGILKEMVDWTATAIGITVFLSFVLAVVIVDKKLMAL